MFQALREINEKVYAISASLKLLGNIAWPLQAERDFLDSYNKGKINLPQISYIPIRYEEERLELEKLLKSFTPHHPLEVFTHKTIKSYLDTIELNRAVGTADFTELSKRIFGAPGDLLPNSDVTNVQAAEQVVNLADEFNHSYVKEPESCISAEDIKNYMERRIRGVFKDSPLEILITPDLAAKATATSKYIKIRSGTDFNHYDFKQLFYHEVMTHSLTALNGEAQPILKCMGRGSLRTLKTQEGLATFAEVITGAIDIQRLKRLALRILAIDMALNGASFLDVFHFFIEKNQSVKESYASAHRIFRGGHPDKNIIFTKDSVYLDGLMNVHTMFKWAMAHNKLELSHLLFCGRVSLEDIFHLEESYEKKLISPPKYLPGWYAKIEGFAGSLSFSLLANVIRINLEEKHVEW